MQVDVLIVGGGPAGLAAAEVASAQGLRVLLTDHKPSLGRKFLMAGKSGLNITKDEHVEDLIAACGAPWLAPALRAFDAVAVQQWARGLGQEVFTGSSGRVFPIAMKGSPLLRAWLRRLADAGVLTRTRWAWRGCESGSHRFDTPDGAVHVAAAATVLAMGGASWSRLGSDGAWRGILQDMNVEVAPFRPANMGFDVVWSAHMARFAGTPVKAVTIDVGGSRKAGEFVVTQTGVEGSLIYAASALIREELARGDHRIVLDLAPDRSVDAIASSLARVGTKQSLSNRLRRAAGLPAVKIALLHEAGLPHGAVEVARMIKACPLHIRSPRPLDEAISVAGGIAAASLDRNLMLRARPGLFAAGEMLDWEAPTGGYLITASMATGRWAGNAAASYARARRHT